MELLLSIRPEFVKKIISHEKKYEFRKRIFRKNVDKLFIYSSSPEKKIIGYFTAGEIVKDNPENLWANFSHVAGISKETFFDYFEEKKEGFAIEIKDLTIFTKPIHTDKLENFRAPQSFCYIGDDEYGFSNDI